MNRKNKNKALSPLWAGLLLFGGLAPPCLGETEATGSLSMQSSDGLVTVTAVEVPLQALIDELVVQNELRLVQHVALNRTVTVASERLQLTDLLDELLKQHSYQLYQSQPGAAGSDKPKPAPGTLWIFSEGDSSVSAATAFFEAVLYYGGLAEKKEVIRELKRLGSNDAVQSLSIALNDADERVQDAAREALAAIGSDAALAAVASTALDSDPWIRAEAVDALSSGDPETALWYLQLVKDDPDPRVRMAIIDAYADIPSEYAALAIGNALEDPDPEVRERALDALEEVEATIAFDALIRKKPPP